MMQRVCISPLVAVDAADAAQPQATSAAVGIAEKLRLEAEVKHHRLLAVLLSCRGSRPPLSRSTQSASSQSSSRSRGRSRRKQVLARVVALCCACASSFPGLIQVACLLQASSSTASRTTTRRRHANTRRSPHPSAPIWCSRMRGLSLKMMQMSYFLSTLGPISFVSSFYHLDV